MRAEVRGRQLTSLMALCALVRGTTGAPVSNGEEVLLGHALDQLTGRGTVPTVPAILALLREPPPALLSAAEGRTRRDYDDATRELRRTLNLLSAGALAGVFDGPSTTALDLDAPGISVDISATAAAGDTLVAAAMLATWAAGFGTVDAATALADAGLAPPRRHLMVMDELWRALRGAPGLVEHADALTRLNRSRGIASLMITHSLADLDALPTRADVAKARGFVERSAIVALGGLPPRELAAVTQVVPLTATGSRPGRLLELRGVLAARRPTPRARQLPAQDRAAPRPATGHGTHCRRERPVRHRHPDPAGQLMRPTPLGPRPGMPPEMATPLAIVAALWGGLALAGVGWASGSAAGWAASGRWDPPPFAVDTAARVLRDGPGPGVHRPHRTGRWQLDRPRGGRLRHRRSVGGARHPPPALRRPGAIPGPRPTTWPPSPPNPLPSGPAPYAPASRPASRSARRTPAWRSAGCSPTDPCCAARGRTSCCASWPPAPARPPAWPSRWSSTPPARSSPPPTRPTCSWPPTPCAAPAAPAGCSTPKASPAAPAGSPSTRWPA